MINPKMITHQNSTSNSFKKGLITKILVICGLLAACDSPQDQRNRFFLKAQYQLKKQNLVAAKRLFSEAITKDSTFKDAWNNRGITFLLMGDAQKALYDYNKAISIDSNFFDARYNRANLYYQQQDYALALTDIDRLIATHPDTAKLYVSKGLIMNALQNKQEALLLFEKALSLAKTPDAYVNRGTLLFEQKKFEAAETDFRQALLIEPNHDFAMANLALLLAEKQQWQPALDLLNKALMQNPNQSNYLNNRAFVKMNLTDLAGAEEDLKRALYYNNQNAWAIRNKAILKTKQNSVPEAITLFEQAYTTDSTTLDLHYYWANALWQAHKKQEACLHWAKSVGRGEKGKDELEKFCQK